MIRTERTERRDNVTVVGAGEHLEPLRLTGDSKPPAAAPVLRSRLNVERTVFGLHHPRQCLLQQGDGLDSRRIQECVQVGIVDVKHFALRAV